MKRKTETLTKHHRRLTVAHCGHPTALWPWAIYEAGELIAAPNGRGFQYKADAVAAARLLLEGELAAPLVGGCRRVSVCFTTPAIVPTWRAIWRVAARRFNAVEVALGAGR